MSGKVTKLSLEGIKSLTIRAHYLGKNSGSAFDLYRRVTSKYSKDTNPDCKVTLVDTAVGPDRKMLKDPPTIEVAYEHGKSKVYVGGVGDTTVMMDWIHKGKDPAVFEAVSVEEKSPEQLAKEEEEWKIEAKEITKRAMAHINRREMRKRLKRKNAQKYGDSWLEDDSTFGKTAWW
ncbi:hypothetical protein AAMO2058_001744900 [Amorphochlora amoebiformis]